MPNAMEVVSKGRGWCYGISSPCWSVSPGSIAMHVECDYNVNFGRVRKCVCKRRLVNYGNDQEILGLSTWRVCDAVDFRVLRKRCRQLIISEALRWDSWPTESCWAFQLAPQMHWNQTKQSLFKPNPIGHFNQIGKTILVIIDAK